LVEYTLRKILNALPLMEIGTEEEVEQDEADPLSPASSSMRHDSENSPNGTAPKIDGLKTGALPFVSRLLGDEKEKHRRGRALSKSPEVALAGLELLWAAICLTAESNPEKCTPLLEALTDSLEKNTAREHRLTFAKKCVDLIAIAADGWKERGAAWRGGRRAHLVYRLFPAILDAWTEKEPYPSSVYKEVI